MKMNRRGEGVNKRGKVLLKRDTREGPLKCLAAQIYILFPPSFELQRAEKLLFRLHIYTL